MESFHKVPKDQTRRSNTMVIDIPAKVVGNASKRRTRCDEDDGIISGLFSLDEEQPAFSSGEKCKLFNEDYESDVEDGSGELPSSRLVTSDLVRRASLPTGALTYGTSLPVTIPAGKFWPPKDAVDSIEEKRAEDESDDENGGNRNKTVLPQRTTHKDLYGEIRAQARSIQAADDPERLFGERPQRRRYRTGEKPVATPQPVAPQLANAVVIVASMAGSIDN